MDWVMVEHIKSLLVLLFYSIGKCPLVRSHKQENEPTTSIRVSSYAHTESLFFFFFLHSVNSVNRYIRQEGKPQIKVILL